MSNLKKPNNSIFELIKEVENEIEEATTSGNIAGYQTPNAFGDNSKKSKKKTKDVSTQAGYTVVEGDIENINESPNEGKLLPKKLTHLKMGEVFSFDGNTYQFIELRPGKDSAKVKDSNGNISVNSFGGGIVNKEKKASGFGDYLSQGGRVWDHKAPANTDMVESQFKGNVANNEIGIALKENRWLDLKNDESMHPQKKLAVGLKELRNQLSEVEKFLGWYNKLKNINELDTDNYWKRTNRNIYKIKERIISIARTLKEIEQ